MVFVQLKRPARELTVAATAVNNWIYSWEAVHALLYTGSSVLCGSVRREALSTVVVPLDLCLIGTKLKLLVSDGLMNKQQTGRSFRSFGTGELSHQHNGFHCFLPYPSVIYLVVFEKSFNILCRSCICDLNALCEKQNEVSQEWNTGGKN